MKTSAALLLLSFLLMAAPSAHANLLEKDHMPEKFSMTLDCRAPAAGKIPSNIELSWDDGGREGGTLSFHDVKISLDPATLSGLFPAIVEVEAALPVFTDAEAEATATSDSYPSTRVLISAPDVIIGYDFDAKKRPQSEAACRKLLALADPLITAEQREAKAGLDCRVTGDPPRPGQYRWNARTCFATSYKEGEGEHISRVARVERTLNRATQTASFQVVAEVGRNKSDTKEATVFSKKETPSSYPSHAVSDIVALLRQPVMLDKPQKDREQDQVWVSFDEQCGSEKISIWLTLFKGTPGYALAPKILEAMKNGLSKTQADAFPGVREAIGK